MFESGKWHGPGEFGVVGRTIREWDGFFALVGAAGGAAVLWEMVLVVWEEEVGRPTR